MLKNPKPKYVKDIEGISFDFSIVTDDPHLTNKKGSRVKSFFKRGCSYIEGHFEGSYT